MNLTIRISDTKQNHLKDSCSEPRNKLFPSTRGTMVCNPNQSNYFDKLEDCAARSKRKKFSSTLMRCKKKVALQGLEGNIQLVSAELCWKPEWACVCAVRSQRHSHNVTASLCVVLVSWEDSREVSPQPEATVAQESSERLSAVSAAEAGGAAGTWGWSQAGSDFILFLTW